MRGHNNYNVMYNSRHGTVYVEQARRDRSRHENENDDDDDDDNDRVMMMMSR